MGRKHKIGALRSKEDESIYKEHQTCTIRYSKYRVGLKAKLIGWKYGCDTFYIKTMNT